MENLGPMMIWERMHAPNVEFVWLWKWMLSKMLSLSHGQYLICLCWQVLNTLQNRLEVCRLCCVGRMVNIYIPVSVSYRENFYVWYMVVKLILPLNEMELNCTTNSFFFLIWKKSKLRCDYDGTWHGWSSFEMFWSRTEWSTSVFPPPMSMYILIPLKHLLTFNFQIGRH